MAAKHYQRAATEDLPQALLARILGMAGLWGPRCKGTAGWSVCRAWHDAMMQNPGSVAESLVLRHGSLSAALLAATKRGCAQVVQALLSSGAHVDGVWEDGAWPLWRASDKGHVEVVRTLLSAGALVDLDHNWYRHLITVCGIQRWPCGGCARPAVCWGAGGPGHTWLRGIAAVGGIRLG